MPWSNIPKSKWGKMERCIKKVMGQKDFKPYKGKTKEQSANAVCYMSIMGKK